MFITVTEFDKRHSSRVVPRTNQHGAQREQISVLVSQIVAVEDSYRHEAFGMFNGMDRPVTLIHLTTKSHVVCIESREEIEAMILKAKG